jgi:hypothetical protein
MCPDRLSADDRASYPIRSRGYRPQSYSSWESEVEQLSLSSAEVKNEWIRNSIPHVPTERDA